MFRVEGRCWPIGLFIGTEPVDILRVAPKKLVSDTQGVEQAMCLHRSRAAGFLTKFQSELEQTSAPFRGTRSAFGEDVSIPVEATVRPEVLDKSAASWPFRLHAYWNLRGCTDAGTHQNHDLLRLSETLCNTLEAVFVAGVI